MPKRLTSIIEPETTLVVCAGASAALLAGAHLFERVGGLPPCSLCLDQREAHWAALAISMVAIPLILWRGNAYRFGAAALGALVLVYAFSTVLAGYHAGVEWKFWAGPQICSAGPPDLDLIRNSDILSSLAEPSAGPPCSEAAWRMVGVSMAGYNAVISLVFTLLAAASCARAARGLRDDRVSSVLATD